METCVFQLPFLSSLVRTQLLTGFCIGACAVAPPFQRGLVGRRFPSRDARRWRRTLPQPVLCLPDAEHVVALGRRRAALLVGRPRPRPPLLVRQARRWARRRGRPPWRVAHRAPRRERQGARDAATVDCRPPGVPCTGWDAGQELQDARQEVGDQGSVGDGAARVCVELGLLVGPAQRDEDCREEEAWRVCRRVVLPRARDGHHAPHE